MEMLNSTFPESTLRVMVPEVVGIGYSLSQTPRRLGLRHWHHSLTGMPSASRNFLSSLIGISL